jgi:hypothetical protein
VGKSTRVPIYRFHAAAFAGELSMGRNGFEGLVGEAGLEPATPDLEGRWAILYAPLAPQAVNPFSTPAADRLRCVTQTNIRTLKGAVNRIPFMGVTAG